MSIKEDRVRALIAEEAVDWFVANLESDPAQGAAFAAWLRTSPTHIEEYLRIALIARDLRQARDDPPVPLDELVARSRAADEGDRAPGGLTWLSAPARSIPKARLSAAVAAVALAGLGVALLLWQSRASHPVPLRAGAGNLVHLQTRHGELSSRELPDHSTLHLNTDTEVTVHYDRGQRLLLVKTGQVEVDVAHDPLRKFLVRAGTAELTAVGTRFDVYARQDATVVTVLEGRIKVADAAARTAAPVEIEAGQQARISNGAWPPAVAAVDTRRASAWLRRQLVFERERLDTVAAEFSRYSPAPIEIDTPALGSLQISGVFSVDDTASFITFLRSLDGVRVEVSAARVRVARK